MMIQIRIFHHKRFFQPTTLLLLFKIDLFLWRTIMERFGPREQPNSPNFHLIKLRMHGCIRVSKRARITVNPRKCYVHKSWLQRAALKNDCSTVITTGRKQNNNKVPSRSGSFTMKGCEWMAWWHATLTLLHVLINGEGCQAFVQFRRQMFVVFFVCCLKARIILDANLKSLINSRGESKMYITVILQLPVKKNVASFYGVILSIKRR